MRQRREYRFSKVNGLVIYENEYPDKWTADIQ